MPFHFYTEDRTSPYNTLCELMLPQVIQEPLVSAAVYTLVALVSLLSGGALLSFIRPTLPANVRFAIFPLASTAFWTLSFAFAMVGGLTVRHASLLVWLLTVAVCVVGIARGVHRQLSPKWVLGLCFILPIAVMAPGFSHGLRQYQISVAPDGWSYIAGAQYLWEFPVGSQPDNHAPLYQYAKNVQSRRLTGMVLLGFFSRLLVPGDTQMAFGQLQAHALFVLASACAAFAFSIRLGNRSVTLFVVLTVFSGWITNTLLLSNLDHLLALAYFPASVAILNMSDSRQRRSALLLGGFLAALLITYIEGAYLIIPAIGLVALWRIGVEHQEWKSWLKFAGYCGATTCTLLAAEAPRFATFLLYEMPAIMAAKYRPGHGLFTGLLSKTRFLPAFWGLGPEWGGMLSQQRLSLLTAAAVILTVLSLVGFASMTRAGRLDLVATSALLLASIAFMLVVQHYSYGAYKIITFSWLLLTTAVVLGMAHLSRVEQWHVRYVLVGIGLAACVSVVAPLRKVSTQGPIPATPFASVPMNEFRALKEIRSITGGGPLLVTVDDWLANEWAVYYLRREPIYLATYRGYMRSPGVIPHMDASKYPPLDQVRFVLSDDRMSPPLCTHAEWQLLWSSQVYRLWKPAKQDWAIIADITNPNGLETINGKPFFWMGGDQTVLTIVSKRNQRVHLRGDAAMGPGLPGNPRRYVRIETSTGHQTEVIIEAGPFDIELPIAEGKSTVGITVLDKPTVLRQPSGDTTPLVLGVKGLHILISQALGASSSPTHGVGGRIPGEPSVTHTKL